MTKLVWYMNRAAYTQNAMAIITVGRFVVCCRFMVIQYICSWLHGKGQTEK